MGPNLVVKKYHSCMHCGLRWAGEALEPRQGEVGKDQWSKGPCRAGMSLGWGRGSNSGEKGEEGEGRGRGGEGKGEGKGKEKGRERRREGKGEGKGKEKGSGGKGEGKGIYNNALTPKCVYILDTDVQKIFK